MNRIAAPQTDGTCLQVPSLADADSLYQSNRRLLENSTILIGDRPLPQLRSLAQAELKQAAAKYVDQYASNACSFAETKGVVLSGHQPELFHPGVWYKNFALSSLGDKLNCAAINLVIDTEVCRSTQISLPTGHPPLREICTVPFDSAASQFPYERTEIRDGQTFRQFGEEVRARLADSELDITDPIIEPLWRNAIELSGSNQNLGQVLAASRHLLEQSIGLKTWEVPLSLICSCASFAEFTAHILSNLPRFSAAYQRALNDYRKANRLRSKTHPAPDLQIDGDRFETPFWIWSKASPQRTPLYVRLNNDGLVLELSKIGLADRTITFSGLPSVLQQLFTEGVTVCSRALLTTMYARLVLSDLFIHGIGGAKYDRVTDAIIQEFFGMEAPTYFALSATFRLPLALPDLSPVDLHRIDGRLRDIRFHPENEFSAIEPPADEIQALIEEKQDLLASKPARGHARQWHRRLTRVNALLHEQLRSKQGDLQQEKRETLAGLQQLRIFGSREFSFVLFSLAELTSQLRKLAKA